MRIAILALLLPFTAFGQMYTCTAKPDPDIGVRIRKYKSPVDVMVLFDPQGVPGHKTLATFHPVTYSSIAYETDISFSPDLRLTASSGDIFVLHKPYEFLTLLQRRKLARIRGDDPRLLEVINVNANTLIGPNMSNEEIQTWY